MLRFNAVHAYNMSRNVDGSHDVARTALTGVKTAVLFGDAGTATETIIFDGLTWTVVASGATGRQFNIGGSAAASATSFAVALAAHADGANYVVTDDLAGTVTLARVSVTAVASPVTGTFNTSATHSATLAPASGVGVSLTFDDAVATTKLRLWAAVTAMLRALRKDGTRNTAPSTYPTSTTTTE